MLLNLERCILSSWLYYFFLSAYIFMKSLQFLMFVNHVNYYLLRSWFLQAALMTCSAWFLLHLQAFIFHFNLFIWSWQRRLMRCHFHSLQTSRCDWCCAYSDHSCCSFPPPVPSRAFSERKKTEKKKLKIAEKMSRLHGHYNMNKHISWSPVDRSPARCMENCVVGVWTEKALMLFTHKVPIR